MAQRRRAAPEGRPAGRHGSNRHSVAHC